MIKHTPGPWLAVGSWVETADDKADICNCSAESMGQERVARPPEEEEANARLIAAAPELLDALTKLCADCNGDNLGTVKAPRWAVLCAAETAIARATGEKE
jgi:hypothetical protein